MKKIFSYYLKPYYLRMAVGFLIKFTGTLMDLFLPWTLAYMIDTVIPGNIFVGIFHDFLLGSGSGVQCCGEPDGLQGGEQRD